MKHLVHFDRVTTKIIGKIPKSAHPAFNILGYLTLPSVWAGITAFIIILDAANLRQNYTPLLVLMLIPLATIMKLFIRRTRPPTIYAEAMRVKSYSFPSSHAYSAALAGGYLAFLANTNGFPLLSAAAVALIGLIGISRVHLGAHYPSDVITGWLLGGCALCLILLLS